MVLYTCTLYIETPQHQQFFSELPNGATASFTSSCTLYVAIIALKQTVFFRITLEISIYLFGGDLFLEGNITECISIDPGQL